MSYKQMVRGWDQSDLKRVLYHYAIQGTLDIYTSIINDGDRDGGWTVEEFAECVEETFSELNFDDDDVVGIRILIIDEYQDELKAITAFAESKQKPKSWARLVRFE